VELSQSRALIIGMGAIGRAIAERLAAFGVAVTGVRRSPSSEPGLIAPDAWRARLGEFDWIVLAAPLTAATRRMIGAEELARMKASAWLVNIARGGLVDQPALIAAAPRIGGAILDVADPEPAPPDDPIWGVPNLIVTMHMSGNAQTRMWERAAALFLENLERYRAGQPLRNVADLDAGY
jgi:phosphoglycerate dehydrogenase-like enzyme